MYNVYAYVYEHYHIISYHITWANIAHLVCEALKAKSHPFPRSDWLNKTCIITSYAYHATKAFVATVDTRRLHVHDRPKPIIGCHKNAAFCFFRSNNNCNVV